MVLNSVLNILNSNWPDLQAEHCQSLLLMMMEMTAAVSVSILGVGGGGEDRPSPGLDWKVFGALNTYSRFFKWVCMLLSV